MAGVFAFDVTHYPACGGHLRLIDALTDPASIPEQIWGVTDANIAPSFRKIFDELKTCEK